MIEEGTNDDYIILVSLIKKRWPSSIKYSSRDSKSLELCKDFIRSLNLIVSQSVSTTVIQTDVE